MTDTWHGYIVFEKTANLNQENFDLLCETFGALPPDNPLGNADFMHGRRRLDDGAEQFECKFTAADVDLDAFVQMMADLFEIPAEDVESYMIEDVSYSGDGRETRWWGFAYPIGGNERLRVARFGRGENWTTSNREQVAYLITYAAAWGDTEA